MLPRFMDRERTVQSLIVDRTHQVLVSGKLVLQKNLYQRKIPDLVARFDINQPYSGGKFVPAVVWSCYRATIGVPRGAVTFKAV